MKIHFFPLLTLALTLTVSTSEARHRRAHGRSEPTGGESGGGLARERGLSHGEAAAAGAVIGEIASSHAKISEAPVQPARRYSPDYYRVYSQRPTTGTAQRVAVAAKPAPVPAAPPVRPAHVVAAATPMTKPVAVKPAPPAKTSPVATVPPVKIRAVFAPAPGQLTPPAKPAVKAPPPAKMKAAAPEPQAPARVLFRDPNRG